TRRADFTRIRAIWPPAAGLGLANAHSRRQSCPQEPVIRWMPVVTSNLPFDELTGVFASERLTGALLGRLTHHVHILEMNGDSYRLKQSRRRQRAKRATDRPDSPSEE
ncbi:MAG: hypothetical protein FJX68_12240, partial [Alphaproteobacteria bacterium]|nr:hypothetical protein [Alphaproteobacteria bacterium]